MPLLNYKQKHRLLTSVAMGRTQLPVLPAVSAGGSTGCVNPHSKETDLVGGVSGTKK